MTTPTPTSFYLGRASITAGALFLASFHWLDVAHSATGQVSTLAGPARVVDGDTIDVNGQRIRLEGIDAPETAQSCSDRNGGTWPCGHAATRALAALLANADVACDSRGNDKYGRLLAVCFADGRDINAEMVKSGFAWAFVRYSTSYVAEEAAARAAHIGVWQGPAEAPWDFRHQGWQTAEVSAPQGCAIKGNISHKGQIYHMPWSPWYDKVKIDPSRGERWFCSEAEAQAAGWRPAATY
jgi:endonuclease YncB( thermonuclease family)